MKRALTGIGILVFTLSSAAAARAADATIEASPGDGFSAMLGLQQWLLMGGANVAVQYKTGRWAFEYSHGQALRLNRFPGRLALTSGERNAGLQIDVPWTTGGGVGLRLTRNLHALIEVKAHRFEISGPDRNQRLSYTTFSIGPGLFYDLHLWRGLFLQPAVRWWPNVADTLDEGQAPAFTAADGTRYQPAARSFGFFVNASLGWNF
jgi:hypothetical protein